MIRNQGCQKVQTPLRLQPTAGLSEQKPHYCCALIIKSCPKQPLIEWERRPLIAELAEGMRKLKSLIPGDLLKAVKKCPLAQSLMEGGDL